MSGKLLIETDWQKSQRAKKRVNSIGNWYSSIPLHFIGTLMMVFLAWFIDPPFWLKANFLVGPVLWWVFFIVQAINLFLPETEFLKRWEARQIEKLVQQEENHFNSK